MFKRLFKKKRADDLMDEKYEYETIDEPFNEILEKCMGEIFGIAKKLVQKIGLVNKGDRFFQLEKNKSTIKDIKILASYEHNIYKNVFKKMNKGTSKDYKVISNILYYLSTDVYNLEQEYPGGYNNRPQEFMDLVKALMKASRCIKEKSLEQKFS